MPPPEPSSRGPAKRAGAIDLPGANRRAGSRILFDGSGRYGYERPVSGGLRERVFCDGKNFWHLYPELGVGARRPLSRFHRAEFFRRVPWALPPAEDLAHGADLKRLARLKVAIIPRTVNARRRPAISRQVHLVFAADGRLKERRLVEIPSQHVLARDTLTRRGWVPRRRTAGGRTRVEGRWATKPIEDPDLTPDVKGLVVVPMPFRTPAHLRRSLPKGGGEDYQDLDADTALALLVAENLTGEKEIAHTILADRAGGGRPPIGLGLFHHSLEPRRP
jgi:hypothetical protein